MDSNQFAYQIIGDDLQLVEVTLGAGRTVVAEAGAMLYMEQGIEFEAKLGDGSQPNAGFMDKLFSAGKRILTGESLFMTHFTNHAGVDRKLAFASFVPGKIIHLNLGEVYGNELICQKEAFLCAPIGTRIDIAFTKKIGAGLFGGEGFILQRLVGQGSVFLNAGGTIIEKRLNGESLRVDTGCIVAFEKQISYDIQLAGGLKSMLFGGEGAVLATLSGTGRVWLQSLPFGKLANRIAASALRGGSGGRSDGGSVLGKLGSLFED